MCALKFCVVILLNTAACAQKQRDNLETRSSATAKSTARPASLVDVLYDISR